MRNKRTERIVLDGQGRARVSTPEKAMLEGIMVKERLSSISEAARFAVRFTAKGLGVFEATKPEKETANV